MITNLSYKKTKLAIVIASILKEPFACIFPLLPFFLLKDLGAIASQIVLLTILRPVSSIFSFYFSEFVSRKSITLRSALLWAGLLARIGFIPALLTDNVMWYVFGSTVYMIFTRAEIPSWMEVIKKNIPKDKWEKTFSLGSIISYSTGVLYTILFVSIVDSSDLFWKIPFSLALLLGVFAILFQVSLIDVDQKVKEVSMSFKQRLIRPLQDSYTLMREKTQFRKFQWSFMIGGLGLMIIQPVIPLYFTNVLEIKYSDLMIAFCICKALGFVVTTPLWNKMIKQISHAIFVVCVLIGFALFSFFLIFSSITTHCIFLAYLIYGVAQAGSHLIWHLSGPLFSGEDSSSRYSGVNIVMVGIRGLVGPLIGWLLMLYFSSVYIFMMSMFLSLCGSIYYITATSSLPVKGKIKA